MVRLGWRTAGVTSFPAVSGNKLTVSPSELSKINQKRLLMGSVLSDSSGTNPGVHRRTRL